MYINATVVSTALAALSSIFSKRTVVAPGIQLRILPLGASIFVGFRSKDYNGYRQYLLDRLSGSNVQYVGTVRSGTMKDNWNEGHSGYNIATVQGSNKEALSERPNVILLHVGTNDLDYDSTGSWTDDRGAADRLGPLIDEILGVCPDATLLVAQIVGSLIPTVQKRYDSYNAKIPGIVQKRVDAGKHVLVVDARGIKGSLINTDDKIHPTDEGYSKLADVWFSGLQLADSKGWIKPPVSVSRIHPANPLCITKRANKPVITGEKSGHFCHEPPKWQKTGSTGRISHGVGKNGLAVFQKNWEKRARAGPGIDRKGQGHVKFADITGNGRNDFIWIEEATGSLLVYGNSGTGSDISWVPINNKKIISSGHCALQRLKFAKLTTSGKPDYICIDDKTGRVDAWLNGGPDASAPNGWKWTGPIRISEKLPGGTRDAILFADVNGDGLDDLLVRGGKGELDLWLNVWKANSANTYFQAIGRIASGTGTANKTLADLNNDGRADIIIFNGEGAAHGFLNVRGQKEGFPVWKEQPVIAAAIGEDWRSLRMTDLTGDGKAELVYVRDSDDSLDIYVNNAKTADTSVVGDGTFFADLNGDGLDDKFLMDKNGQIIAYINSGLNAKAPYGWLWLLQNNGDPIALGVGAKRENYRWADVNGDGRADMLVVDPKTGIIKCWLNLGPNKAAKPRGWVWDPQGQISPSRGAAAGVFFGDIDGDGRADLLWISETSEITIFINTNSGGQSGWTWSQVPGVLNFNAGYRKDIRVADFNGDGYADIAWVHPIDGSTVVWINGDYRKGHAGWARQVPFPKNVAPGFGFSGANVHFARIHIAHGRADYVAVAPGSGAAYVWKNICDHVEPADGTSLADQETHGVPSGCDVPDDEPSSGGSSGGSSGSGSDSGSGGDSGGQSGSGSGGDSGGDGNDNGTPDTPDTPLIPFITIGDSTFTANSATQFVISGQTLTPGGEITVGSTMVSLESDGDAAVVGGSTQTAGHIAPSDAPITGPAPTLTLGAATFTADSSSQFVIDGQTLTPNGVITVSGTPISLGPDGSTVVIAGSTEALGSNPTTTSGPQLVLTLGDSSITANSNSQFVIGGQTLTPGGTITVSGTPIQLGSDASSAVVGTSTEAIVFLPPGPTPSSASGPLVGPPSTTVVYPCGTSCTTTMTLANNEGLTIDGYTTIPSPTKHAGSRPTSGFEAFHALRPFAINALNSINSAIHVIGGFSGGSGAQGFATAADTLAGAFADLSSLGADLGSLLAPGGSSTATATENAGVELSFIVTAVDTPAYDGALLETEPLTRAPEVASTGETLTQTTPEIEGAINELTQQTGRGLSLLQDCIANPGSPACLKFAGGGITSIVAVFGGAYNLIHGVQSLSNLAKGSPKGTPTPSASASASSSSNPAEPTEWILNTVPGTSVEAFDKFIKTLPDRGQGERIVYSNLRDQMYVGRMTRAEAEEVNKNPIVDQMSPDADGEVELADLDLSLTDRFGQFWNDSGLHLDKKRISSRQFDFSFEVQGDTPSHLALLSFPPDVDWSHGAATRATAKYVREESEGANQFVYVIDSGLDTDHDEFKGVPLRPEYYADPILVNRDGDQLGHGTRVSSMIIGRNVGVARKVQLIAVKHSDDVHLPNNKRVQAAWRWVVNDIILKERRGKSIINLCAFSDYGRSIENNHHVDYSRFNIPIPATGDTWVPLLASAWENDIVTVIAVPNFGEPLGQKNPCRFGKADNALITVGRLEQDGAISPNNGQQEPANDGISEGDTSLVGHIDVYGIGEGLIPCTGKYWCSWLGATPTKSSDVH